MCDSELNELVVGMGDALPNEATTPMVKSLALSTGGCEGDQGEPAEPETEEKQEIQDDVSELYEEKNTENILSRSNSNASNNSAISEEKSSKIPIIAKTNFYLNSKSKIPINKSKSTTSMSKSTTSISKIAGINSIIPTSLSTISNKKLVSTPRKDIKKSPKIIIRGLELELKASKKKYLETKNEYDDKEKALVKISNGIIGIINKISEISGKEKVVDDDLSGFKKFLPIRSGEKEELNGPDLTFFINDLKENNKLCFNFIDEILNATRSMFKFQESREKFDPKELISETTENNKKVGFLKRSLEERQRCIIMTVENLLREPFQQITDLKCKKKDCERIIKDQEKYKATLKKSLEEKAADQEKQKEVIEKYKMEIINKNKEIDSLKEENMRVHNLHKTMTKASILKDREYKESIELLSKKLEESTSREKMLEKKCSGVREKLGNVQLRENNLKKKLCDDCKPNGCQEVKRKLLKELEEIRAECKDLNEKLEDSEIEKRNIQKRQSENEMEMCTSVTELEASTKSLSSGERTAYKRITKRLRAKIQKLQTAKEEAELEVRERMKNLLHWENELKMRENNLYDQINLKGTREMILDLLKKRNERNLN